MSVIRQNFEHNPRHDYPLDRSLVSVLDEAVASHPNAKVCFMGDSSTQEDIIANANANARALVELGILPGNAVGVCMDRSIDLLVVLLAILKAGASFVPLSPDQPGHRLNGFIEDAAIQFVIADEPGVAALTSIEHDARIILVKDLNANGAQHSSTPVPERVTPDSPAYVIFTSGSTGRPKGAILPHRSIVNRITWLQEEFQHGAEDCVLQKTPIGFDVSVWELFWPFLSGARMEIAEPGGHLDVAYLARTVRDSLVTFIHFVPTVLRLFLQSEHVESCSSLRTMISSGETLTPDLASLIMEKLSGLDLYNVYGPTETAFVTAWRYIKRPDAVRIPIGRPIANVDLVLMNSEGTVPIGEQGELCIGGVQVGLGYVGRQDLTATRFVPHPDGSGRTLYRTGDFASWNADGLLEFLGRMDRQVKISGNRIEPAEVESAFRAFPAVLDVAVLPDHDSAPTSLIAFVAGENLDGNVRRLLRRHLMQRLPLAAVPATILTVRALPQLPNGKTDRQELARLRDMR